MNSKLLQATIVALAFQACLPAHAALVAYYTYDNASNLGLDSSGNGNNLLTASGAVATTGKAGGGVDLNGSSGILYSASGTLTGLPTGASSYTVATWFNADPVGGTNVGGFLGWGNYGAGNSVNAFRLNGTNGLDNYWWGNDLVTGNVGDLIAGSGINGWHYVAATYDATTHINRIWLDGTQVASRTATGINAAGTNFAIGKTYGTEYFDGQLDNTAIFNTALTQSQIVAAMSGDVGLQSVPEPGSLVLLGIGAFGAFVRRRQRT